MRVETIGAATLYLGRDEACTRPAVRWFGGKWRLAPWIIEHLPPHRTYVEPYGGGRVRAVA